MLWFYKHQELISSKKVPNTAPQRASRLRQSSTCTRPPTKYVGATLAPHHLPSKSSAGVVGRYAVRVFRQFLWLKAGSVKSALSRPIHQPSSPLPGRSAGVLRDTPEGAERKPLARTCKLKDVLCKVPRE